MKYVPHRAPGNYDPNSASAETALVCKDDSLTQQHHRDDADINLIVKRYNATGVLPTAALAPLYGDFTDAFSFHEAQNKLRAATEAFQRIPPEIRARFGNDPGKFIEFAVKEENQHELARLKLRDPIPSSGAPPGAPDKAQPVPGGSADPTPKG